MVFGYREREIHMNRFHHIRTHLGTFVLILGLTGIPVFAAEMEVPVLDAEAGICSVAFTVSDPGNKPVYGAKIRTMIRYGILGIRKLSLEIVTNSDGKAKIIGLPRSPKRNFKFEIVSGNFLKQAEIYPSSKCEEDKIDILFGPQDTSLSK
jgi:hypothetical protein